MQIFGFCKIVWRIIKTKEVTIQGPRFEFSLEILAFLSDTQSIYENFLQFS